MSQTIISWGIKRQCGITEPRKNTAHYPTRITQKSRNVCVCVLICINGILICYFFEHAHASHPRDQNNHPRLSLEVWPSKGLLVGGWTNPFEQYDRQNGNLPQVGVKIKNVWNHHLVFVFLAHHSQPTRSEWVVSEIPGDPGVMPFCNSSYFLSAFFGPLLKGI